MRPYDHSQYLRGFPGEREAKEEFLAAVREILGCRHAVAVSSGTAALEVVLKALDLPLGASVLVPDLSFIATATAVASCGLVPEYVDVSRDHFGMTRQALASAWHRGVRAVIYVHLAGIAGRELLDIRRFCRERDLPLVEDCAQAFGALVQGAPAGTLGDAGTFSFQSSKIIQAGEGGLVVTDRDDLAAACEAVADWGMSPSLPRRDVSVPSSNLRLSAVQAFLLTRQLDQLDEILQDRAERVEELTAWCRRLGLDPALPEPGPGHRDCHFFFPLRSRERRNTIEPRDETPMWRSRIVHAILSRLHPALLDRYLAALPRTADRRSLELVDTVDFLNIQQTQAMAPEALLAPYVHGAGASEAAHA